MDNEKLLRYFNNNCSEAERQEVEFWLQADDRNAQYYLNFVQAKNPVSKPAYDKEKVKARLLDEVQHTVHSNSRSSIDAGKSMVGLQWMKVAAVVLVIMLGGIGGYMLSGSTALGGKEIVYKEHTVPDGEIDSLMLSDGTEVKLNAGTTLRYPQQFTEGHRRVYLTGEAYFNVARDKMKPFQVHTGEVTTTVLGTAFNVTAYSEDQQLSVAVTEGEVRVAGSGTQMDQPQELTLTPNQLLEYNKQTKRMTKREGEVSTYTSWKEGILTFDDEPLPETARKLERWYDVDISLQSPGLSRCIIHGKHKGETLGNVLKTISFATGITYEFTEQGVVISGGRCK